MSARITIGSESMTIEQAEVLLEKLKENPAETLNGVSIDVKVMDSFLKECRETFKDFNFS